MSDAMKIAGDSAEAIDFAKKSLTILEWLTVEHPADTNIRALVADRNLTLGIALEDAGDLKSALDSDRAALTIQQELVSNEPADKEAGRPFGHAKPPQQSPRRTERFRRRARLQLKVVRDRAKSF
jgi:hypothetical protein